VISPGNLGPVPVTHNLRRSEDCNWLSRLSEDCGSQVGAGCGRRLSHGYVGTLQPFHFIFMRRVVMAAHCQVTGAEPGFGHSISHSHRRNKRRFDPNIQKKRYWVPSLRRNVTLQVSARGIKTIDVRGIDVVVAAILARGVKL
jgi:large subunit ribosomal protein L28